MIKTKWAVKKANNNTPSPHLKPSKFLPLINLPKKKAPSIRSLICSGIYTHPIYLGTIYYQYMEIKTNSVKP